METDQIIWIVVAVIVVLALLALLAMLARKRKAEQNRHHAESLRQEARSQQSGVHETDLEARRVEADAQRAKAEAERARVEAEEAEARAAEARQGNLQEHAKVEDQVREADRIDPDVDNRSENYQPGTPGTTERGTDPRAEEDPVHRPPDDGSGTGGSHRA